jgi:hypothetical protein
MSDDLHFNHYFTECGCVYNKNIGDKIRLKLLPEDYQTHKYHKNYRKDDVSR